MTKPYPALCRDCKYSTVDLKSPWNGLCSHPKVNAKDPWTLANPAEPAASNAKDERSKTWFAVCGMKGKLWEAKE